jgi:ATP-binding cassette subfamily B protein/subfamily B ATP-binding cassette protein MsbA
MNQHRPSRQTFEEYKAQFDRERERRQGGSKGGRDRSSRELIASFLRMLRGHRTAVVFALSTLTAATVLALIPPAATKFVVDNVLGGKP